MFRSDAPASERPVKRTVESNSEEQKIAQAKRVAAEILDKKPDGLSGLGLLVGQYRYGYWNLKSS